MPMNEPRPVPVDEPRGFPIRMTGLRWAHVGAIVAAVAGLFLPWVSAGSLSVQGIKTTPGVIYTLVLVLAVIIAFWHGVRTSNYWYALDRNRVTGSLLTLSWLVLLAVAVYESVHLASAHSPTTGKAEVVGIGLAIDTVAALIGSVVATIDARQNWSQSQAFVRRQDTAEGAESDEAVVLPRAARIRMLRPAGAWAIAAVGILAVAGAGLAGHNAGWTPIAKPVSHTTHRPTSAHGRSTSQSPGAGGHAGAPATTGPTGGSTTPTAPGSGSNSGNTGSGAGNTGNTAAGAPDIPAPTPPVDGVVPPVGIGNTPPSYGLTPPPPVTNNTGATGATGSTGSTGSTGTTGNTP
jgi:hypothetical protein